MQEQAPVRQLAQAAHRAHLPLTTFDTDSELRRALELVHGALKASATILYTPEPGPRGWELSRCIYIGSRSEDQVRELERALANAAWDYDPLAVEAQQRNRALTGSELRASPLVLPHCDQVRALICHGPRLLAWVGVLRERTFDPSEASILQAHIDALRQPLVREWSRESASLNRSLFECLLETLRDPALVLSERGRVEYANSEALAWLDADSGASTLNELRDAIARGAGHPGFEVVDLEQRGCPGYTLVRRVSETLSSNAAQAIASKRRLWDLDARQTAVLERVAQGRSNKQIAAALGCAEVTVERVLTRLLRLSGSRSRGELIARLHQP